MVKNKLIHDLRREATNTRHRDFIALNDAMSVGKKRSASLISFNPFPFPMAPEDYGLLRRFPPSKMLTTEWYFPVNSNVRFSSLDESHQMALRGLHRDSILRLEPSYRTRLMPLRQCSFIIISPPSAPASFATSTPIRWHSALGNTGHGHRRTRGRAVFSW